MKSASIDGTYLVMGSMNWTAAGEQTNDENTLLIDAKPLAAVFDRYYERLWQSIDERWAAPNARPDPESWESGSSCTDGVDNDFDDLADDADEGCGQDPPPLPPLPPHVFVSEDDYGAIRSKYRLIRPTVCHPSYPDWFVCLPAWPRQRCKDLPYRHFTVKGTDDPLGLDRDGDGFGC